MTIKAHIHVYVKYYFIIKESIVNLVLIDYTKVPNG